jgi:hypothetical protein
MGGGQAAKAVALETTCERLGWFPEDFGLKDHHVFWFDGYYYLISNYLPGESRFAYARSVDFCHWERLADVLPVEASVAGENMKAVWAPFVYVEDGIFYLFYSGVTRDFTQRILLAVTENPADPSSWQEQGVIFQPDHADMIWLDGGWADCRDPMVFKSDGHYYLYYTGMDVNGGIVGVAKATSPEGPWRDWGAIISPIAGGVPESATVASYAGAYYLFYNDTSFGEVFRIGASPTGPWLEPQHFIPGWAHEVWQDVDGQWYTSYLTSATVTISPLAWDDFYDPVWPFIGENAFHVLLPFFLWYGK